MQMTYQTIGTNTYLTVKVDEQDALDTMSLGMLTNNKIPGFATTSFMQMDAVKYIQYNVTSKVSAAQLFNGPVNKKRLIGVLTGIVNAMISAEEYMIDPATILLDMDHIFSDVSTCETSMICLPVIKEDSSAPDLSAFFKNIIFRTQFDQTENCDHVAQIINYLNTAPVLSLPDFKAILDRLNDNGAAAQPQKLVQPAVQPAPQPVAQPTQPVQPPQPVQPLRPATPVQIQTPGGFAVPGKAPASTVQATAPAAVQKPEKEISFMYLMQHYNKENVAAYKAQQEYKKAQKASTAVSKPAEKKAALVQNAGFQIPGQVSTASAQKPAAPAAVQPTARSVPQPIPQPAVNMNFGETTVLGGGTFGETTVLGAGTAAEVRPKPHLIRIKNNERIALDKPVFRIGKEKSYVDYFIGDNTAISRSHANIVSRDGEYFVVDTNSTNHTYVNGSMIQSNVETKIFHDTKIRLANEEFVFKTY